MIQSLFRFLTCYMTTYTRDINDAKITRLFNMTPQPNLTYFPDDDAHWFGVTPSLVSLTNSRFGSLDLVSISTRVFSYGTKTVEW